MQKSVFSRIAGKWWLMLVVGLVIGLAVGLPVGGMTLFKTDSATNLEPPSNSADYTPTYITVSVGQAFYINPTISGSKLDSTDGSYLGYQGASFISSGGLGSTLVHNFVALRSSDGQAISVTFSSTPLSYSQSPPVTYYVTIV